MKKEIYYRIATILGGIAILFVSTASLFFIGQPSVPDELLKVGEGE
ncbi:cyclic lactone autoinducer peptide [Cohnella sp. LGH]|nr:cyclic lactone autoinducer peptide [Cohnella sp. LGH]QTH44988.1 cyclic lactone autoinducer peptide [Cohnella sp. LGH]